jgi:hypothetical protein
MGGPGSGKGIRRKKSNRKTFTSELHFLDSFQLFRLHQQMPLSSYSWAFGWIKISRDLANIEINRGNHNLIKQVSLTSTPCFFGKQRYWFVCPSCKRNIRKLYLQSIQLGCQRCLNLEYPSQNETTADRILRKRDRIIKRLTISSENCLSKPIGMHKRTYLYLKALEEKLVNSAYIAFLYSARNAQCIGQKGQ